MKKENEQSDFRNLPACVAEYIKLVIKKMKWQKDARADVQAELIGHFEDAIRDCKSDGEKEIKAKELIENFGDAKLIADLARRAKKRCRPLWVKMFIKAFQAACIIIGLFILYSLWFISGKPEITTNYIEVANKMVRPTADDSQNAAPLYEQAAKIIQLNKKQNIDEIIDKNFSEANEVDINIIKEWLNKNTEALRLVAQGSQKPYFWRSYYGTEPNDTDMVIMAMPEFTEYRKLAYSLRWRAYLYAQNKQYDLAFSDLLTAYKFGKHIKGHGSFVESLIGIAMENISVNECKAILSKDEVPAECIKTFLKNLQIIVRSEDFSLVKSMEFNKIRLYDEIQRCFTKDFFGLDHLYMKRLTYRREKMLGYSAAENPIDKATYARNFISALLSLENSQRTRLAVDQYCDLCKNAAIKPPYQLKNCDIDTESSKFTENYKSLHEIILPWNKLIEFSWRNKADIESTLAVVALHIYKQKKGNWPENLQELVSAGLLTSVPMDPYSDKPLVYKKTDNDFILYSCGSDFDDDGGKIVTNTNGTPQIWNTEDGDAVFWPVRNK